MRCVRAIPNTTSWTMTTPASSEFQKHLRSTAVVTTAAAAAVQHQRTSHRLKCINRNACTSPFQLATPPGFQVNHITKGDLVYMYKTKIDFVRISVNVSLPAAGLSRAIGSGARGGPRCTLRRKLGTPAGLRGACSGHSKSRELGSKSRYRSPPSHSQPGPWKPITVMIAFFHLCCCF